MLALVFVAAVVIGFVFWFMASIPGTTAYSERIARGLFLLAAILWAIMGFAHGVSH